MVLEYSQFREKLMATVKWNNNNNNSWQCWTEYNFYT